jgi:hypothetical protein
MIQKPIAKITMRCTAGEFWIKGVRVGSWRETAPGVVHAQTISGLQQQFASYDEADAAARESVLAWVKRLVDGDMPS